MSTEFTDFGSGDIIEADHIKQTFDPIRDLENGASWYRSSDPASPANTYKVSFASGNVVDAYSIGLLVHLKAHASNLGPSTLIIAGPSGDLAPMALTKKGGLPLEEGDIVENQVVSVVFTEDLDENDNVIAQRFEVIGGIGSGGALSDPAWAIFDVLDTDLTQSDLSGQDLPLGSRLEGEQVSANANHRVELDEGLYSISFSVSCEINSGDALEVGVYDYSGGGAPVQLAGSSVAVVGDEDTHDSPVGHAILSVAEGQTKEIGLRTGTRLVDGTIHAGKGFFKVLKVSGGVASSGGVTNLDGLSDVSIGTVPSDGEILQFDSGIGKFRNVAFNSSYAASEVSDDSGVTSPAGTVAGALTQLDTAISANSTSIGSNTAALSGKEDTSNKNQAGGYPGLDGSGLVPPNRGGTGADLSATGGSGQVLKQESVGGAITVGSMSASDIGGGTVSDVEFGHLDGVSGPIQGQLDGKQDQDATLDQISSLSLAKGDLLVHNGSSLQNLSAGSNGEVLQANSATTTGLEWAPSAAGATELDNLNDVSINAPTSGHFLKHDGTDFKNVSPADVRTALDVPTNAALVSGLAGKADANHSHDVSCGNWYRTSDMWLYSSQYIDWQYFSRTGLQISQYSNEGFSIQESGIYLISYSFGGHANASTTGEFKIQVYAPSYLPQGETRWYNAGHPTDWWVSNSFSVYLSSGNTVRLYFSGSPDINVMDGNFNILGPF